MQGFIDEIVAIARDFAASKVGPTKLLSFG